MDLRTGAQRGLETKGRDIRHEAFDVILAMVIVFCTKEMAMRLEQGFY